MVNISDDYTDTLNCGLTYNVEVLVMKPIDLSGTPRPHFVRAGEWSRLKNKFSFRGKVVFSPKDDVSLADRDHVNVAHEMFAIWNAAHFATREGLLYPNMRVLSQYGAYFIEVPIDTEVDLFIEVEILNQSETRMKGIASATFRNSDGKILSTKQLVFVANK